MFDRGGRLLKAFSTLVALLLLATPVSADLRVPPWWDQNAVGTTPDWHYRVAVNIPATATVNSTMKVDVDFGALMTTMGISGTFDVNSPRVVRAANLIVATQEFTDTIYAGATDATGNGRGEVRFILQDAGPTTYYIYFDITQNGAKAANPQTPVNGNFERGATGTAQPAGWNVPSGTATLDAQVRPSETVSVTSDGTGAAPNPKSTNGAPNTGSFSYLIGARSANEAGASTRTITRTFAVPLTNPGNFTIRWRAEGWDAAGLDALTVRLTAGATTVNVVGPSAATFATAPYSPNAGSAAQTTTAPGNRPYNNFDMTSTGAHTQGMTVAAQAEPWWTRSVSLASFAGQTVTLTITSSHTAPYRSWFHIDDVEWSVANATLGSPQGFGVKFLTPTGAAIVRGSGVPLSVIVDAQPTASSSSQPVNVEMYNNSGNSIRNVMLFNDGTHGDAVAGDAIWTNDGSVTSDKLTVPAAASGNGWVMRVFARDSSSSTIGARAGVIRGPGTGAAAETEANFWNIDDFDFSVVNTGTLSVTKTSSVVSDPYNLTVNPKRIPGATIRYCVLVANGGVDTATSIVMHDVLPTASTYVAGSIKSGTSCIGAIFGEDDNNTGADESDPFGADIAGTTVNAVTASLLSNASMAITFDVTIK